MELSKDALEYLVEAGKKLVPVEIKEFDLRLYSRNDLKPIMPPVVSPLRISTLSSLVELCTRKFDDVGFENYEPSDYLVHVVGVDKVQVVAAVGNEWEQRGVLIDCNLTETIPFQFGKFLSQEQFIIGMLSCFHFSGDRDPLVKLAGAAKAEAVTLSHDDGISQEVTVKGGAHLVDRATAKSVVQLSPYRTFREVDQPESEFLFRMQQSGENLPTFALFEADGGAWRLEAIENIARKLRAEIPEAVVVS